MTPLLNTLFVTTEGAMLRKDGETVAVDIEGRERSRLPLHMIGSILAFGAISISPALIGACARAGITIGLFERSGRFLARIEGPVSGNVLLRRAQYRVGDDTAAGTAGTAIARAIVAGKLLNQRAVLQRGARDHADTLAPDAVDRLSRAIERIGDVIRRLDRSGQDLDALRGAEGEAADAYFSAFDDLIRVDEPVLRFSGRSRRPPRDPVNALLSFLYTLLVHDCRSGLEGVGLDPAVGFLHRDRPGRPSLALDLMEELRPVLCDRMALSLINRRQLSAHDFETREGAVTMTDDARRTVLTAWHERKRDERRHPFLEETVTLGLVPHLQARLLARHLRGDLDGYPPFLWR